MTENNLNYSDRVSQPDSVKPMTRGERLAYGAGEIYGGGYAALLGVVLTFFLTNLILVGIPHAEIYAAIIIVISKYGTRFPTRLWALSPTIPEPK